VLVRKLCLGSVQWGSSYGISNTNGQTEPNEVLKILNEARLKGIQLVDTATSYGMAETVLGNYDLNLFSIVTKTPMFEKKIITKLDAEKLINEFKQSLQKLNIDSCYGLLLHHKEEIFKKGSEHLISALNELKSNGLVKKIGISIYDSTKVNEVVEKLKPDIIQLPLNVLDQRVIQDGTLKDLKSNNIEIHARSIFLQGLLLMPHEKIPTFFKKWQNKFNDWERICLEKKMNFVEAALNFVINQNDIDYCIIGVESLKQLKQCISATELDKKIDVTELACNDIKLINPTNWKIK
jgi:aryl-alcohol dehydrogenase-like predicted oxidoreductase